MGGNHRLALGVPRAQPYVIGESIIAPNVWYCGEAVGQCWCYVSGLLIYSVVGNTDAVGESSCVVLYAAHA